MLPWRNIPWLAPEFHLQWNNYKTQRNCQNHSPMIWNQSMTHWHKLTCLLLWLPSPWQNQNFHGPTVQTLERQQKRVVCRQLTFLQSWWWKHLVLTHDRPPTLWSARPWGRFGCLVKSLHCHTPCLIHTVRSDSSGRRGPGWGLECIQMNTPKMSVHFYTISRICRPRRFSTASNRTVAPAPVPRALSLCSFFWLWCVFRRHRTVRDISQFSLHFERSPGAPPTCDVMWVATKGHKAETSIRDEGLTDC